MVEGLLLGVRDKGLRVQGLGFRNSRVVLSSRTYRSGFSG